METLRKTKAEELTPMPGDDGYVIYLIQDWVKGIYDLLLLFHLKEGKRGIVMTKIKCRKRVFQSQMARANKACPEMEKFLLIGNHL